MLSPCWGTTYLFSVDRALKVTAFCPNWIYIIAQKSYKALRNANKDCSSFRSSWSTPQEPWFHGDLGSEQYWCLPQVPQWHRGRGKEQTGPTEFVTMEFCSNIRLSWCIHLLIIPGILNTSAWSILAQT